MNIQCLVVTNIDHLQSESWPRELACRPQLGEYMVSASGKKAKITSISHGYKKGNKNQYSAPYLEIEVWQSLAKE